MRMKCYDCGRQMQSKVLVQYPRRREATGPFIFEDVPCLECPKCGRKYFSEEVSRLMDDVMEGRVAATGRIEAPTYSLRGSAA
jgi:YgiT-type zinc finger domain-containing protein